MSDHTKLAIVITGVLTGIFFIGGVVLEVTGSGGAVPFTMAGTGLGGVVGMLVETKKA